MVRPVGWRKVSGGNSTSASAGKAETQPRSAPRSMKEPVFTLRMSDEAEHEYWMATASEVVVLIGASSVPPVLAKSSASLMFLRPRQRSIERDALGPSASTARSCEMASRIKLMRSVERAEGGSRVEAKREYVRRLQVGGDGSGVANKVVERHAAPLRVLTALEQPPLRVAVAHQAAIVEALVRVAGALAQAIVEALAVDVGAVLLELGNNTRDALGKAGHRKGHLVDAHVKVDTERSVARCAQHQLTCLGGEAVFGAARVARPVVGSERLAHLPDHLRADGDGVSVGQRCVHVAGGVDEAAAHKLGEEQHDGLVERLPRAGPAEHQEVHRAGEHLQLQHDDGELDRPRHARHAEGAHQIARVEEHTYAKWDQVEELHRDHRHDGACRGRDAKEAAQGYVVTEQRHKARRVARLVLEEPRLARADDGVGPRGREVHIVAGPASVIRDGAVGVAEVGAERVAPGERRAEVEERLADGRRADGDDNVDVDDHVELEQRGGQEELGRVARDVLEGAQKDELEPQRGGETGAHDALAVEHPGEPDAHRLGLHHDEERVEDHLEARRSCDVSHGVLQVHRGGRVPTTLVIEPLRTARLEEARSDHDGAKVTRREVRGEEERGERCVCPAEVECGVILETVRVCHPCHDRYAEHEGRLWQNVANPHEALPSLCGGRGPGGRAERGRREAWSGVN
eukprot:scaffold183905_cov27-Tisochrysis_lutea.AAC.1